MKNIAFISPTGTLDNGAEISIVNFMKLLTSKGYNVFNIFPHSLHSTRESYIACMIENNISFLDVPLLNWWWEDSPAFKNGSIEERAYFYQQYIFDIRKYLRDNKIDVVISNTANVFQGALAAAFEEIEHFWLVHEFPIEEFAYYRQNISFMKQTSDRVFSVRGHLNEMLSDLFSEDFKVASFMPFSEVSISSVEKGVIPRIVSIGKINDNKNQIELLKAYVSLNNFDLPLVFIGDWEEDVKQKLDKIIENYHLTNVIFLGHKENPWNYITDKDICVYTSKAEAFSLVFVESILHGMPTIISDIMGYDSVKETFQAGYQYHLGNIEELSQLISSVISDFEKHKDYALEQQKKAIEIYTIENAYSEILSSLEHHSYKVKSINPLKSIVGTYSPKNDPWLIHKQFLTVYEADSSKIFTEESSSQIPLKFEDEIKLNISSNCCYLRLDFAEKSGLTIKVRLFNDNQEIQPEYFNAVYEDNAYSFFDADPQLHYNLGEFVGTEIIVKYKIINTYDFHMNKNVDKIVQHHIQETSKLQQTVDTLESDKLKLHHELVEMTNRYNSVINSRRWKYPSQVINFFRRK